MWWYDVLRANRVPRSMNFTAFSSTFLPVFSHSQLWSLLLLSSLFLACCPFVSPHCCLSTRTPCTDWALCVHDQSMMMMMITERDHTIRLKADGGVEGMISFSIFNNQLARTLRFLPVLLMATSGSENYFTQDVEVVSQSIHQARLGSLELKGHPKIKNTFLSSYL